MAIKTALILLCVVAGLASASEKSLKLKYKSSATLDCSELKGDVQFFARKQDENEPTELNVNKSKFYKQSEDGKQFTITELCNIFQFILLKDYRFNLFSKSIDQDSIRNIQYSCKTASGEEIKFKSESKRNPQFLNLHRI